MTILYRGMDRAALDAAYLNTKAIPDFPAVLASCQACSAAPYDATPGSRDLRYGPRPAQRFDWLRCGRRTRCARMVAGHAAFLGARRSREAGQRDARGIAGDDVALSGPFRGCAAARMIGIRPLWH